MTKLIDLIQEAEVKKPAWGKKCNHCGWCCMTETCPTARDLGAGEMIPCKFLKTANERGEYLCSLAGEDPVVDFGLAIGTGCDSVTQRENMISRGLA